jgi:hypothetical protein
MANFAAGREDEVDAVKGKRNQLPVFTADWVVTGIVLVRESSEEQNLYGPVFEAPRPGKPATSSPALRIGRHVSSVSVETGSVGIAPPLRTTVRRANPMLPTDPPQSETPQNRTHRGMQQAASRYFMAKVSAKSTSQ